VEFWEHDGCCGVGLLVHGVDFVGQDASVKDHSFLHDGGGRGDEVIKHKHEIMECFWAGLGCQGDKVDHDDGTWGADDLIIAQLPDQGEDVGAGQGGQEVQDDLLHSKGDIISSWQGKDLGVSLLQVIVGQTMGYFGKLFNLGCDGGVPVVRVCRSNLGKKGLSHVKKGLDLLLGPRDGVDAGCGEG